MSFYIIEILDEEGEEDLEITLKYLNEFKIALINTVTMEIQHLIMV